MFRKIVNAVSRWLTEPNGEIYIGPDGVGWSRDGHVYGALSRDALHLRGWHYIQPSCFSTQYDNYSKTLDTLGYIFNETKRMPDSDAVAIRRVIDDAAAKIKALSESKAKLQ